jgi:nicotinate-nucleotide adenylyltransferase
VWWLVSPQNPLKLASGMAPYSERLESARRMADDRRIRVSDIEARLDTRFTVDTLDTIRRHYPDCRFVWLMGADNLAQLPRWRRWKHLIRTTPIAVFARPGYSLPVLSGPVARRLASWRISSDRAGGLVRMEPPAWTFLPVPPHTASASAIRAASSPAGRRD